MCDRGSFHRLAVRRQRGVLHGFAHHRLPGTYSRAADLRCVPSVYGFNLYCRNECTRLRYHGYVQNSGEENSNRNRRLASLAFLSRIITF